MANEELQTLLNDKNFKYFPELGRVAYVDAFVTIYPVRAISLNEKDTPVYSYIGIPIQ